VAKVTVEPSGILAALAAASPGDTVEWSGTWEPRGKKITGIRGEEGAPITLQGASQDAAIISGRGATVFAARIEDCRHFRLGNCTVRDFTVPEQRGVQVWAPSEWIELFDLRFEQGAFDFIHTAGANHVVVRRCQGDGATQQGRPGSGVGAHGIYHTRLNTGGDVEDFLIEDCSFVNVQGSVYQLNGDGRTVRNATFRRIAGYEFGRGGGAGVNLEQCENVDLLDVTLTTTRKAGGVRAFNEYDGIGLARYAISVVGFPPVDAQDGGHIDATPGTPAPPQFEETQPPDPPPTDDYQALYEAEKAKVEAWEEWNRTAQAGVPV